MSYGLLLFFSLVIASKLPVNVLLFALLNWFYTVNKLELCFEAENKYWWKQNKILFLINNLLRLSAVNTVNEKLDLDLWKFLISMYIFEIFKLFF